jgi:Tfp pilus assembly protein PilX
VETTAIWVLIALVLIGAIAFITLSRMRSQRLRERFGSEYERTVRTEGTVRKAEAALEARARRVQALHIRPLSPADSTRFDTAWRAVQARFVDDPRGAVTEADRLVGELMSTRGYPVGEFEQRVADISVDHPDVVMNYRAAREIALQHSQGKASTEDLRQAMVHYRALFRELLETAEETVKDVAHDHHTHRHPETPAGRH